MDTSPNSETTPNTEGATSTAVESSPIAEVVQNVPLQPQADPVTTDPAQDTTAVITDEPKFSETITKEEAADIENADIDRADSDWIGKVREVIKDDEGKPYKEEEDAEVLNEQYMKARFNVDVDAPVEEK